MTKLCTDIEQSQKLIELGIDTSSADMVYCVELYKEGWKYSNEAYPIDGTLEEDDIPAWSLSALLELIKNSVGSNVTFELVYLPSTTNGRGERLNETFRFSVDDIFTEMDIYEKEPIDAVYSMVVWLSENKKA